MGHAYSRSSTREPCRPSAATMEIMAMEIGVLPRWMLMESIASMDSALALHAIRQMTALPAGTAYMARTR